MFKFKISYNIFLMAYFSEVAQIKANSKLRTPRRMASIQKVRHLQNIECGLSIFWRVQFQILIFMFILFSIMLRIKI